MQEKEWLEISRENKIVINEDVVRVMRNRLLPGTHP